VVVVVVVVAVGVVVVLQWCFVVLWQFEKKSKKKLEFCVRITKKTANHNGNSKNRSNFLDFRILLCTHKPGRESEFFVSMEMAFFCGFSSNPARF